MKKFFKSVVLAAVLLFGGASAADAAQVTVKSGDSLWEYQQQYNVPYQNIMSANNLKSDLILVGQNLTIPEGQLEKAEVQEPTNSGISNSEIDVLASLVRAEALGESMSGKIAVAAVVLNRVDSPEFPDTINGVIFEHNQFSPVANGSINQAADRDSYEAAKAAINGADPSNGAVYFYNPATASDHWIRTRPVTAVIDNHKFAK